MKKIFLTLSIFAVIILPFTASATEWLHLGAGIGKQTMYYNFEDYEVPVTLTYGKTLSDTYAIQVNIDSTSDFDYHTMAMASVDFIFINPVLSTKPTVRPYLGFDAGIGFTTNKISGVEKTKTSSDRHDGFTGRVGLVGGLKFFVNNFVMGLEGRANFVMAVLPSIPDNFNTSDVTAVLFVGGSW